MLGNVDYLLMMLSVCSSRHWPSRNWWFGITWRSWCSQTDPNQVTVETDGKRQAAHPTSVSQHQTALKKQRRWVCRRMFHLVHTTRKSDVFSGLSVRFQVMDGFFFFFLNIWYIYIGWPSWQFKFISACSIILHSDYIYCYLKALIFSKLISIFIQYIIMLW